MRLTEQYYMLTSCGLTPVRGKKYTEEYAVTYNHEKKSYNLTHIKSGTCISKDGFKRMKDCISAEEEIACIANDLDGIGDSLKHVLENIAMSNKESGDFVDRILGRR